MKRPNLGRAYILTEGELVSQRKQTNKHFPYGKIIIKKYEVGNPNNNIDIIRMLLCGAMR
jgi:hypothetical protein